jgi:hypothetical protein
VTTQVSASASHVNKHTGQQQNLRKVREVAALFDPAHLNLLDVPARRFVREGAIMVQRKRKVGPWSSLEEGSCRYPHARLLRAEASLPLSRALPWLDRFEPLWSTVTEAPRPPPCYAAPPWQSKPVSRYAWLFDDVLVLAKGAKPSVFNSRLTPKGVLDLANAIIMPSLSDLSLGGAWEGVAGQERGEAGGKGAPHVWNAIVLPQSAAAPLPAAFIIQPADDDLWVLYGRDVAEKAAWMADVVASVDDSRRRTPRRSGPGTPSEASPKKRKGKKVRPQQRCPRRKQDTTDPCAAPHDTVSWLLLPAGLPPPAGVTRQQRGLGHAAHVARGVGTERRQCQRGGGRGQPAHLLLLYVPTLLRAQEGQEGQGQGWGEGRGPGERWWGGCGATATAAAAAGGGAPDAARGAASGGGVDSGAAGRHVDPLLTAVLCLVSRISARAELCAVVD